MTRPEVETDERTLAISHRAGNQAYKVMTWLLVLGMGVRGLRPEWATWNGFPADIVAVLLAGALTHTWYNRGGVTNPRRVSLSALLTVVVASGVAAGLVYLVRR